MAGRIFAGALLRDRTAITLVILSILLIAGIILFMSGAVPVPGTGSDGGAGPAVTLTPEEQAWIAAHPVVHVCPDPSLPPFEFRDRNGDYTGIAADYLSLISARTGITFVADKRDNWSQCVLDVSRKDSDLLGGVYVSDLRKDYLVYSDPYFKTPIVILTRSPGKTGLTLNDLAGKRVATVNGFTTQKLLREKYPGIIIDSVPDTRTGLREVSLGNADAFFGDLPTAAYIIAEEGIPNLQVSGEYTPEEPYSFNIAFGVRKDWPELAGILNKGLASIGPREREGALKKYISLNLYPQLISTQVLLLVLAAAGACLLIILIVLIWNRSLKIAVQEKTGQLSAELEERRRAEAALQKSEEKYRTLVENLHAGVYQNRMDDEGTFIWTNRAMREIFGYDSEDEFRTRTARDLYANPENRRELLDLLSRDGHVKDFESQMVKKDGTLIWVSLTARVRRGPDGRIEQVDGIIEDITGRKNAKDELIRANEDLREVYEQLSRTERELWQNYDTLTRNQKALELARKKLSILNAVTFQDIRNAIFSLSGYFELMKESTTDERQKRFLEKERRLLGTITESIRFADNFQNLGLSPPRWQDIRQTFSLGISHLPLLKQSREVDVNDLEIYADPLLENVFLSLTENVVQHANEATIISLTSREEPDGIVLVFADNGPGIPYENKETIFERKHGEKRGLGLFLSREILGVTGITIRETGEPGRGARFEIHVPKGMFRTGKESP